MSAPSPLQHLAFAMIHAEKAENDTRKALLAILEPLAAFHLQLQNRAKWCHEVALSCPPGSTLAAEARDVAAGAQRDLMCATAAMLLLDTPRHAPPSGSPAYILHRLTMSEQELRTVVDDYIRDLALTALAKEEKP